MVQVHLGQHGTQVTLSAMVLTMEDPGYPPGAGHRCVVGAHVRKALEVRPYGLQGADSPSLVLANEIGLHQPADPGAPPHGGCNLHGPASVAQGIERRFPKPVIQVRVLVEVRSYNSTGQSTVLLSREFQVRILVGALRALSWVEITLKTYGVLTGGAVPSHIRPMARMSASQAEDRGSIPRCGTQGSGSVWGTAALYGDQRVGHIRFETGPILGRAPLV